LRGLPFSAKYIRYERMAKDLQIDPKLVEEYMLFAGDKIGEDHYAELHGK
jgi:ubiquinol-cytochrome c reductase cytochrome c1 subunit